MFFYFIAVITGAIITITPILNGQNTIRIGTLRTAFFHNLFAVISGLFFLVFLSELQFTTNLSLVFEASPINYIGGFFGLFVILLMNYYSVRIKALYIALLPFLGQIFMGLFIDYWILGVFSLRKVIGMSIVLLGIMISNQKNSS